MQADVDKHEDTGCHEGFPHAAVQCQGTPPCHSGVLTDAENAAARLVEFRARQGESCKISCTPERHEGSAGGHFSAQLKLQRTIGKRKAAERHMAELQRIARPLWLPPSLQGE